jgi:hypothetical protein
MIKKRKKKKKNMTKSILDERERERERERKCYQAGTLRPPMDISSNRESGKQTHHFIQSEDRFTFQ